MAIEHRLMHLETLSYMLPHLPVDSFVPEHKDREREQPGPQAPDYLRTGLPEAVRIIEVPSGDVTLGRPRGTDGAASSFGWDNEYAEPLQPQHVPRFSIDARNVTNGEFLTFVQAGGYADRSLWDAEAWQWRHERGLSHPVLWSKRSRQQADDYFLRATFEVIPLPLDWPVSVSLAEARAYVRFRARRGRPDVRLPSEAELARAAYGVDGGETERAYPWGDAPPVPLLHGNFGCARYDCSPVGAFPAGDSAFQVADLIGNGWEWSATPFQPLPGFAIDPLYPGYSQPFFDGKHFVMKGASARTDVRFLRRSFRNWFQPHYPYVFATFRCAYDAGTR
jgi:iron(II)-dependent oxidoreductase